MFTVKIQYGTMRKNLEFPCDEKYLEANLTELKVPLEKRLSPIFFAEEVTGYDALKVLEGSPVNLDEINYLAKRLDSFDEKEIRKFNEALANSKMRSPQDMINLTFNEYHYVLIQDVSSPEHIGREYILQRNGGISETEELETDFAKIGKDLIQSGKGKLTEHGLLIVNDDMPYCKPYDGVAFPAYYYESDKIGVALQYNSRTEYVYLPAEEIAIQKALRRLGAPSEEACAVQCDYTGAPGSELEEKIKTLLQDTGVSTFNAVIHAMGGELNEDRLQKLTAIAEYAEITTKEDLVRAAGSMLSFIVTQAQTYEEVGRYCLYYCEGVELPPSLEAYFSFRDFGMQIAERHNGRFLENGMFVCMDKEQDIHQTFQIDGSPAEESEEMRMDSM